MRGLVVLFISSASSFSVLLSALRTKAKVAGTKSCQAQDRRPLRRGALPPALARVARLLCLPFAHSIVRRVFVIVARSYPSFPTLASRVAALFAARRHLLTARMNQSNDPSASAPSQYLPC